MEATYEMQPVKHSPQDAGSVITYQRRYAIGAILNLNIDEDDDGNKASQGAKVSKPELMLNSDNFVNCRKAYLADKTKLKAIQEKYNVSPDVLAKLTEA